MKLRKISGLDPRIQEAIEKFRSMAPSKAFDACKLTSANFTRLLINDGMDAKWVQLSGAPEGLEPIGKWADIDRIHWIHYVTKVGGLYIDWTASQFGDDDSVPSLSVRGSGWNREHDVTDSLNGYLSAIDEGIAESLIAILAESNQIRRLRRLL